MIAVKYQFRGGSLYRLDPFRGEFVFAYRSPFARTEAEAVQQYERIFRSDWLSRPVDELDSPSNQGKA